MGMNLENKIAVVTGGAKGIGLAISEKLAEVGATVYALGRSANIELDTKYNIIYKQCDVSDLESVANTLTEIHKESGTIDILVNNAGITKDNLLLRMSEKDFDDVINVNLKSVFNLTKNVFKPMMKQRFGRIVNISSVVGLIGNAGQSNYAASKAGIIGFTKATAKEFSSRNINVNAVAPGFIETEMTAELNEKQKEALLQNIPLKRMGKAEDIANLVKFLCSDKADYITGQVISVDGGMVM